LGASKPWDNTELQKPSPMNRFEQEMSAEELTWEQRRGWSAVEVQAWMNKSGFREYSMRIVEEDIDGESMFVADVSLLRMVGFKLGPAQKCLDLWKLIPTNVVTTGCIPDAVSTVSASSSAFNIESPQRHVYILCKNTLGSMLNSCFETFTASSAETFE